MALASETASSLKPGASALLRRCTRETFGWGCCRLFFQGLYTDPEDQSLWRHFSTLLFHRRFPGLLLAAFFEDASADADLRAENSQNSEAEGRRWDLLFCLRSPRALTAEKSGVRVRLASGRVETLDGEWVALNAPLATLAGGFNSRCVQEALSPLAASSAGVVFCKEC